VGEALVDERVDGALQAVPAAQDLLDVRVLDVAAEPVGAEQPDVPRLRRQDLGVDLRRGVHVAEHAHEHGAPWVGLRLLLGDPAAVDEPLDEGVILRHLRESAVAQQIQARVADVREREFVADGREAAEGRAHARELGPVAHRGAQHAVGLEELILQRSRGAVGVGERRGRVVDVPARALRAGLGDRGAGARALGRGARPGRDVAVARSAAGGLVEARHRLGRQRRRDVAARMPSHAVCDEEQPVPGVGRVLVVRAHHPDVGADGAEIADHGA